MLNNLPSHTTKFIGRQDDIQHIITLLDTNRLVTLLGMGGIGKTRLSIEIGHRFTNHASEAYRVYFVPLAPVSNAKLIAEAIADTVGASLVGNEPEEVQLATVLKDHHTVLIVDNIEHVIEGIGLLDELLTRCPDLHILATSREKLHLTHEYIYAIQGMAVPHHLTLDEAIEQDAIQLFTQIAQRVDWNFQLTDENVSQVVAICRRVDGVPLAIELSAAWLRMMSEDKILAYLEKSFNVLADSLHHVPERHRSIRAVFESSWQLLTQDEQIIYSQLSVFRGGFTHDTIEVMLGASTPQILSLLDKSLIHRQDNNRYVIHELLRQYTEEKLQDFPAVMHTIHERHARYFATFLENRLSTFKIDGTRQSETLHQINQEFDNIREMWYCALEKYQFDIIQQSVETLYHVNRIRGTYSLAFQMFEDAQLQILNHDLKVTHIHIYAKLITMMAIYADLNNQNEKIVPLANEANQLARQLDLPVEIARSETALSIYWATVGDLQQAKYYGERAVKYYDELTDIEEHTNSYINLGWTYQLLGDFQNAERIFIRLVLQNEANGNIYQAAQGNIWLALINNFQGKYLAGKTYGLKALSQFESIGGDAYAIATRKNIAVSYWGLGNYTEARKYFLQTLYKFIDTQYKFIRGMLSTVAWMVHLIHSEGNSPFAAEVGQFVLYNPDSNHETREIVNKIYPTLQQELSDLVLDIAKDRGQSTSVHQMVEQLITYFELQSEGIKTHPAEAIQSINDIILETLNTGIIPEHVTDNASREIAITVVEQIENILETEKAQVMSKFVENASHDLRTPITIINSSLYLLEHIQDADRQKDKLELVKNQVNHLHRIIENLLLMSRVESDILFEFRPIDVVGLIKAIHTQTSPQAELHNLQFPLHTANMPIIIKADTTYLQDAIIQLLDNAFHHTEPNDTITISCTSEDDNVAIRIQDTGVGIEPEHLPFVFDRFYRVDVARKSTGQSGLGLAIVQTIVKAHRGTCEVISTPQQGSTFTIYLPLL